MEDLSPPGTDEKPCGSRDEPTVGATAALAREVAEEFVALAEAWPVNGRYDPDGCDDITGPIDWEGWEGLCNGLCEEIGCMRMKIAMAKRLIALRLTTTQA